MLSADFYQDIAPWVAVAFGAGYFVHGARQSIRNRQRDLRQKLRKVLRQSYRRCCLDISEFEAREKLRVEVGESDIEIPPSGGQPIAYAKAAARIEDVILEGLSSPNRSHLDYIKLHLNAVYLSWAQLKMFESLQPKHNEEAPAPELAYVIAMLRTAQRQLEHYIRVTAKIDDGSYLTYLRYKYRKQEIKLGPVPD